MWLRTVLGIVMASALTALLVTGAIWVGMLRGDSDDRILHR